VVNAATDLNKEGKNKFSESETDVRGFEEVNKVVKAHKALQQTICRRFFVSDESSPVSQLSTRVCIREYSAT
jgi:hypothetical protein